MTTSEEKGFPLPRALLALAMTALFFVSPLIFFTDLTRNPYYFQITLLNTSLLAALALLLVAGLRRGRWPFTATPLDAPLAVLAAVCAASFLYSYFGHKEFFRAAILSEGLKWGVFFAVNCVLTYYISYRTPYASPDEHEPPAGKWLLLIICWGALWALFPWLRSPASGLGVAARMLDPYGLLVWSAGCYAVWLLVRRGTQDDILHLAMSVGAIASLYGVLEYFHIEFIWAKLINPYGNRSVSTFGNPNFISSYVVMLLPLALRGLLAARGGVARSYYALVILSYGGMLMASLTRSSWLGAAAGLTLFAVLLPPGSVSAANRSFVKFFAAACVVLLFAWPSASLKPFSSGLVDRISEATSSLDSPAALKLTGDSGRIYASFHQRVLIWASAWQMGLESPLLGKGFGQFELFYPFYQGRLMTNVPEVRGLRTHANNAHNEVLEKWASVGLLGLGAFVWLLVTLAAAFIRHRRLSSAAGGSLAVALAAGLAGMLVDNLLNVSLHFAVPALAFWWLIGALARRSSPPPARPETAAAMSPRLAAASWFLLACCLLGAYYWTSQFRRELHYFAGFKLMRSNNFPGAAAELRRAWEAHPREVNSNYEMGNAYVRTGDIDKGAWAYGEALKANPGYDEIYFNMAIVLKRLGRVEDALNHLKLSSYINPLNPTTWQALAEMYLSAPDKASRAREAAAWYSEAVRIFPYDGNIWNTYAYFHTLTGAMKEAHAAYSAGVKAAPENRMLVDNLLGISRKLGLNEDPAVIWLTKYSELDRLVASYPESAPAGVVAPGLKAAEALLATDPANLKTRALRAKFLFRAGRLSDAAVDLLYVVGSNPADGAARYGLAVVYEKMGEKQKAAAELETLLAIQPGHPNAAARLSALKRPG